jgi:MFS transporter, YQGE family, putative transporter
MRSKVAREFAFFNSHHRQMRMLITTNFIYALALPVIELFVGAYIIRNSSDLGLVMIFQLAQSTGIPFTFLVNGFLLRRFPIARLYALGMFLSCISMIVMMSLHELTAVGVSVAGLVMGLSYGFFWANRVFLALTTTKDESRNYYFGLETFLNTTAFIIMPLLAGHFVSMTKAEGWFGGHINVAYYILTALVSLLTLIAGIMANRSQFKNPPKAPFVYFTFHRLWKKMLGMAALKGLAQGYIITAPVMLIMKLVGEEGSIGTFQSSGALLSAILLYFLGRKTSPMHRVPIFIAGLSLFLLGAIINAIFYSAAGAILFIACLIFARPLMDLAYFPIQLNVIEFVAAREKRNQFTYIVSHEMGLYVGRLVGSGLFIAFAYLISDDAALRFALLIIGATQFMSVFIARSIMRDRAWKESAQQQTVAVDVLKEPIELG